MLKPQLKDVTLLMIETRCHELAARAVLDSIAKVDFGDVVIFTDKPQELKVPGAYYVQVDDWPNKLGWAECYWYEAYKRVRTSHALLIQWDSWVFCPDMWRSHYLAFDYIGAPWWYKFWNVGNSGFGMRSLELMRFVAKNCDLYPVTTAAEDDLMSRKYRPALEAHGDFKWADDSTALDFSFECIRRSRDSRHFGFHALKNWPFVLSKDELNERLFLASKNPYIASTDMLKQLEFGKHPHYLED